MSDNSINIRIEIPGLELLAEALMKLAGTGITAMPKTQEAPTAAAQTGMPQTPPVPAPAPPQPMAQGTVPTVPVDPAPAQAQGTYAQPMAQGTYAQPMAQGTVPVAPAPAQGTYAQPMAQGTVPTVPVAPAPAQGGNPTAQPAPIPTTAVPVTHTYDELAVAASQLVNTGKQARLFEILKGFGVGSLMELPQEKYAAFAGCLRAEGVKF